MLDTFRTELSKTDSQIDELLHATEHIEDVEQSDELTEKLNELQSLITEIQETQNWI